MSSLKKAGLRPDDAPLPSYDPAVYGPLYREFAAEDRELAAQGMDAWLGD